MLETREHIVILSTVMGDNHNSNNSNIDSNDHPNDKHSNSDTRRGWSKHGFNIIPSKHPKHFK